MIKGLAMVVALASLATCFVSPLLYFQGVFSEDLFRELFAIASVGWFVTATVWASARKNG